MSTNATRGWVRTALALGMAGLLAVLAGGILLALGSTASAEPGNGGDSKVAVCHRTASESNPYTFILVPEDEANGHITGTSAQHNSQVVWKSDGTWRGVEHKAGDLKLDYFATAEEIEAGKCFDPEVVPPEEPEEVTVEAPVFTDECDPDNEVLVVPANDDVVTYTTVQDGDTYTVTATSNDPEKWVLVGETEWTFTVDDSACPTEQPTEEPTEEPTKEPTEVLPGDATSPPAPAPEVKDQQGHTALPTTVQAGTVGWSTTEVWGAALLGGGLALLLSSGVVLVGVRQE